MKIAIAGAGAIGGWLGIRLAAAGHDVCALSRGDTLDRLRNNPWKLRQSGHEGSVSVTVRASDDAATLGIQDIVIIAVKAPALPDMAPQLAPLIGPETLVVPAMNGVPWWFMLAGGGELDSMPLSSVDPHGSIATSIPFSSVAGCVVHGSVSVSVEGIVEHKAGNGLIVGEPAGGRSERIAYLAQALRGAGFDVEESENIRHAVWYKLWGNMTINPISAITGATADRILDDPLVAQLVLSIMAEARAIGERIGCTITERGEDRNAVTRKLGAFKTSMLQDIEAGRTLEVDALLAAPRQIATVLGLPTPYLDGLWGLMRLLARERAERPWVPSAS